MEVQYSNAALRHGIDCRRPSTTNTEKSSRANTPTQDPLAPLVESFTDAFKQEKHKSPNYGKATGLGAEKWWANVTKNTFQPFLKPRQKVPQALVSELYTTFASSKGYTLFPDVLPFFKILRDKATHSSSNPSSPWPWDRTIVCSISNTDDRVPLVLQSLGLKVGPRRVGSASSPSDPGLSSDNDIEFVVLSYDAGFRKPDRRIFDAATHLLQDVLSSKKDNKLGVDDFDKLYVGNELEADILGAENAGWNAAMRVSSGAYKLNLANPLKKAINAIFYPLAGLYNIRWGIPTDGESKEVFGPIRWETGGVERLGPWRSATWVDGTGRKSSSR